MTTAIIATVVAMATLAFALAFFFAGFYMRGALDEDTQVSQITGQPAASPVAALDDDTSPSPTAVQPVASPVVVPVSADDDPALGPENAPVLFVQFSDYECPFSKRFFEETESKILSEYGSQVRYVFRDFPLSRHAHAQQAAEAAQCAYEQDKFWEYHDLLFQNQDALEENDLEEYADALGLDMNTFTLCLDSGKYKVEVEKDIEDARSYGVAGSPTVFINGREVKGALPFETFRDIIEEELAKSQ